MPIGSTDYSSKKTPKGYVCSGCKAKGVRLYRAFQSNTIKLECTACAIVNYKKSHEGKDYVYDPPGEVTFEIGWLVAAVPNEAGTGYQGYTDISEVAANWWKNLPEK